MKFLAAEKKLQTAWKLTAKGLPREARKPGLYRNTMYPFCLPLEYAGYNLFQDIREDAMATFDKYNIVWHSSALPGLPSNHLCSSQVFAANLFFPFMDKPEALADALLPFFPDIQQMVPVEDGRFISFEWIGKINYLNENPKIGAYRLRGAGNTSIDAMMAYETSSNERVMLLIEMKYSESYGVSYKRFRSDGTDRFETYENIFYSEISPIDLTIAPSLEDFLYEPFYQLLRHSLLASRIIEVGKPKVSRVQVVHFTVARNKELLAVTSPQFRQHGETTYEVWNKLLKDPQGFSLIHVEDFFKNPALSAHRELESWINYMKNRYSFLR
jgi:hypothetical protein